MLLAVLIVVIVLVADGRCCCSLFARRCLRSLELFLEDFLLPPVHVSKQLIFQHLIRLGFPILNLKIQNRTTTARDM